MRCSGENVILRGIFHVLSCFPLHFMLYCGNLDYFLDSVLYGSISSLSFLVTDPESDLRLKTDADPDLNPNKNCTTPDQDPNK